MGSAQVVVLDHENRLISAGADPRRQAGALGARVMDHYFNDFSRISFRA